VIVAGGMETMSNAPYFLRDARSCIRMGDTKVKDMMIDDRVTCYFKGFHMGTYGNDTAEEYALTMESQDDWSYGSHQHAVQEIEEGKFGEDTVALEVPQ